MRQLNDNKLKSYELGDKSALESETQAEIGRLSDYFAEEPASLEAQGQGRLCRLAPFRACSYRGSISRGQSWSLP